MRQIKEYTTNEYYTGLVNIIKETEKLNGRPS